MRVACLDIIDIQIKSIDLVWECRGLIRFSIINYFLMYGLGWLMPSDLPNSLNNSR
jgi:hypothetical protein